MATDVNEIVRTYEALPGANADNAPIYKRGDRYGAEFNVPLGSQRQNLASEGTYWIVQSGVPGTTVAYGSSGTQATFSDTTGFVVVKNGNPAGSKTRTILDFLRILVAGTVPASATSLQFAVKTDTGPRIPTGAVSAATNVVGSNSSSAAFATQAWFPNAGIPTVPAVQSPRVVGRGSLRQVIPVTLDEYVLKFGPDDLALVNGTGAGRYGGHCGPVVLNAQEFAIIHLWLPSGATNPLTCEIELGGWEK